MLEFKVHDPDEEKSLKETAASAIAQIEEKNYDAELMAKGITKDRIKHYGFAFEGKKGAYNVRIITLISRVMFI